jgi:hypothetical protein
VPARGAALPAIFAMSSADVGPRGNLTLERLTLLPDGKSSVAIMEGPLFSGQRNADPDHWSAVEDYRL